MTIADHDQSGRHVCMFIVSCPDTPEDISILYAGRHSLQALAEDLKCAFALLVMEPDQLFS